MLWNKSKNEMINSPCKGIMFDVKDVNDHMFSQKMLGESFAFELLSNKIVAPVDGKITALFPSRHAIGITSKKGCEILLHIGLETSALDGSDFNQFIQENQKIKAGDLLCEVDLISLNTKNVDSTMIMVLLNSNQYEPIHVSLPKDVEINETLFEVKEMK